MYIYLYIYIYILDIYIYIFIKLAIFILYLLSSTVMLFSALHAKHLRFEKIFCEIDESITL